MMTFSNTGRMKSGWVLTPLLLTLLLSGCDRQSSETEKTADDDVLALVNGVPVTGSDVAFWLRGAHGRSETPAMRNTMLNRLVETELVYQKGLQLGLDKDPGYRREIARLELELKATQRREMMRRVYKQEVAADVKVSPEEVRHFYEAHKDRFGRKLHLETIGFDSLDQARGARKRIEEGESFEEVARSIEDNRKVLAGKAADGDLGMMAWARIPLEWHDVVYALRVDEVSDVFDGEQTGVRLFKLLASEKTGPVEFKDVQNAILFRLRKQKTNAAYNRYLARLKQHADIEYLDGGEAP